MPNSIFSSQIALNKAKSLQFSLALKMPNWQLLLQHKGASAQQFPTKKARPNNFLCLRLLVCVVHKLQHYKRMAYVLSKLLFNSNCF